MSATGPIQVIIDEKRFLELVARETNTDIKDYFNAIRAANLGIGRTIIRSFPVGIGGEIFQEDLVPILPNSIFKVYIQVKTGAPVINIRQKFGTNVIDGKALNGTAMTAGVPQEFNFPVSRDAKYNLFLDIATTIDIARVIEFRIGF